MSFHKLYLWEDPIKSGVVFGSVLLGLVSVCYFSLISVVAYASLLLLIAVTGIKVYSYITVTFLKKEPLEIVAKLSEVDLTVPAEKVSSISADATKHVNLALHDLRGLFLVDCMLDSIKFGLGLWLLTYIGSWFNAMTLIILAWVSIFTVPKIYTNHREQLDPVLDKFKIKCQDIIGNVTAMIPQAKVAAVDKISAAVKTSDEVKKEE